MDRNLLKIAREFDNLQGVLSSREVATIQILKSAGVVKWENGVLRAVYVEDPQIGWMKRKG